MGTIGKWMKLYGEAIYCGRPYNAKGNKINFILKGDKELYLYFFDIGIKGDDNVVEIKNDDGALTFENVPDKVKSIEWLDNREQLEFIQDGTKLSVNATKYPYGMSTCVRVARAKLA